MPRSVRKFRKQAYVKQQGRCCYCNARMWLEDPTRFAVGAKISLRASRLFLCTAEHLVPKCEGGPDSASNIAAACLFCNARRHRRHSALSADAYSDLVRRRIQSGRWLPKELRHVVDDLIRRVP